MMPASQKRHWLLGLLSFAVLLILLRLALPYTLMHYIEERFAKIPEYRVGIQDLDVHLYRGSYVIKGFSLSKIKGKIPVPFFSAQQIDLSVQWSALFKGAFVAEMVIHQPKLNFVTDSKEDKQQLTIDQEWQKAVKALFPLHLNKVKIFKGQISLHNFSAEQAFHIYLKQVQGELNNLRKIETNTPDLPSSLELHAKGMDNSPVNLLMHFDPFSTQPTFKLEAEIEKMQIEVANDFLRHYTKIEIKHGLFSLYVEAAAAKGKITGYAKPLIEHLQVLDPNKKASHPIKTVYKHAVQLASKILENPEKQTVATKIKISGNISDPNVSLWSIIGYVLRNAFIQALLPKIDHNVKLQDIVVSY